MPTSVRDVMTTNVVSFTREESVTDGMQRLIDANVSGGPVVDGENKVVGMLTDSDLIVQDAQLHAPDRDRDPRHGHLPAEGAGASSRRSCTSRSGSPSAR